MIGLMIGLFLILNPMPLNITNALKNHNKLSSSLSDFEINYNLSYQISVQRYNVHSCSGIILNEKFILTAGHCVVDFNTGKTYDKNKISILAGTKNLNSNDSVRILIDKIIPHPRHKFYHYNVALLQLKSKLKLSNTIQPIRLYSGNITQIPIGTEIQISGWRCSNSHQPLLDNLKIDKLQIMSNTGCDEELNKSSEIFYLTHKNLNRNDDICIGDTGGPAIFNDQLIGVSNFIGFECQNDDKNGFININYISKWIKEIIN